MGNESLSLQNFSSLFELFAGYYLLLGTNKKFHDYFNIGSVFKTWTSNYREIEEIVSNAERMEEDLFDRVPQETKPANNVKAHRKRLKNRIKQANSIEKRKKSAAKLSTIGKNLQELVELHFGINGHQESESETGFYKFIKPYYIFFGCLSLVILAFTGYYNEWHRIHTLNIFNWIGLIVVFILFVQVFGNLFLQTKLIFLNPILIFILAIVLLFAVAVFPCSVYAQYMKIPYDISPSLISYNDFQVFTIAILIFAPILIHIFTLSIVICKHGKVERIKRKLSGHLSTLELRKIGEPIQSPPAN